MRDPHERDDLSGCRGILFGLGCTALIVAVVLVVVYLAHGFAIVHGWLR